MDTNLRKRTESKQGNHRTNAQLKQPEPLSTGETRSNTWQPNKAENTIISSSINDNNNNKRTT